MDNQNAINDGEKPQQPANSNPVAKPSNLVNVQTQSVVESPREVVEAELARVKALNDEALRQQKIAARKKKTKRILIFTLLGIFALGLLATLIWLIVNVIVGIRNPVSTSGSGNSGDNTALSSIDGYQCQTTKCSRVADVPDGRILIRDTKYYLYNKDTKEAKVTSIEEQDYHSITPFKWGDKLFAVLDPEADASALFSITENRLVTDYNYDQFYLDINDKVYSDMTDIAGKYIVAKALGQYRLINVATGSESVRADNRVLVHGNYFFGYESNGERRVYNVNGTQILISKSNYELYIKDGYVINAANGNGFEMYNTNADQVSEGSLSEWLNSLDIDTIVNTLNGRSDFYHVPK